MTNLLEILAGDTQRSQLFLVKSVFQSLPIVWKVYLATSQSKVILSAGDESRSRMYRLTSIVSGRSLSDSSV